MKNNYDDIERILEKLAKENPDEMDKIDEIDDSVFDRIEANALSKISSSAPERNIKKKNYIFLKVAAGFVGLFAAFSATLYFMDIQNTRAADDISQKYEESASATAIPLHINMPKFIPEGYNLEYMTSAVGYNGFTTIEMKYINESDENLFILIRVYGDSIRVPDDYESKETHLEMNGMPFIVKTVYSNPITLYCNFADSKGVQVQIAATIDEDTLMKIAESMN